MKHFSIFLCSLMFCCISCNKLTNPNCAGCGSPYPVPGVVAALVQDTAGIQNVFTICDSISNLSISVVTGYSYTSSFSSDSINSFTSYLNSKKYIDSNGGKAVINFSSGVMHIAVYNLYNMGLDYQADWIATMNKLQLTELHQNIEKYIRVNVPIGQEANYASQLAAHNGIFKSASQMFLAP